MRRITDIYEEYKIMPILAMHQLRVAAVAWQICDSIDVEVDRDTIIKSSLLHDMGNVIKFDLTQTKSIFNLSDMEIENIEIIKDEFIKKYGNDEHEATTEIAREIKMPQKVVEIVANNRFSSLCIDKESGDWLVNILHYADSRVGPTGILSYDDRMNDAKKRYENHKSIKEENERQKLVECGKEIEKQIFFHSNIKPEDINDESVAGIIEELKNFEI